MITKIKITDNTNTPLSYLDTLPAFSNGTEFSFTKGMNVIVGPNGSGKTTLMRLIYKYCLCEHSMSSCFPQPLESRLYELDDLWKADWEHSTEMRDGVEIFHDYAGAVYRTMPAMEVRRADSDFHALGNMVAGNRQSTGQTIMQAVATTMMIMFGKSNYEVDNKFPMKFLDDFIEDHKANEHIYEKLSNLRRYYKEHQVLPDNKDDFRWTMLMDEPDRNLDIDNIRQVYGMLTYTHPQVQVIAVIHNPVLIYRLSGLPDINFIEMKKGYMKEVIDFVKEK